MGSCTRVPSANIFHYMYVWLSYIYCISSWTSETASFLYLSLGDFRHAQRAAQLIILYVSYNVSG